MNYPELEKLSRVRLSDNFYMREFLFSEVSNFYGVPNIPVYPDIAIENGRRLCEELLEPLQDHFGRLHIRSGYRSPALNEYCNLRGAGCKRNDRNYARHIWDMKDAEGLYGAMAVIVIPSYQKTYEETRDWKMIEEWICSNTDYSELIFFKRLCAFNLGWHEKPKKIIQSHIPRASIQTSLF